MTGFGQAEAATGTIACVSRVKSINGRYLQISVRLDPLDDELEIQIRRLLQERAVRGAVDVNVKVRRSPAPATNLRFHRDAYQALQPVLSETAAGVTLEGLVRAGIIEPEGQDEPLAPEDRAAVMACVQQAVSAWESSRKTEAGSLVRDMTSILDTIEAALAEIATLDQGRTGELSEKLRRRIAALLEGEPVGEERLLEEVAYVAQRSDITEELDRLKCHLAALKDVMSATPEQAIGRRIEFLLQEIQREVNTVGSKAQDVRISARVVDVKVLVEKLKQQSANLE
ncbi:MAG: DUF1732 domain-containing protein [Acidobacteriota bacterium]